MATAKELGFKSGDIAIWGVAFDKHRGGIPLDTPGAEVNIEVGRIIELEASPTRGGVIPVTRINVLWASDYALRVGTEIEIHPGFENYIGEGDERLAKELKGAGITILTITEANGETTFEVQRETL